MADCHSLFLTYNSQIKLSDFDRDKLRRARKAIRQRISFNSASFKNKYGVPEQLEFQSQGSYVMDTIIKPDNDDFDLDDGIYILGARDKQQRPPVQQFHNFIIDCLGKPDQSVQKIVDKDTCVRVQYEGGFHIDLPIYYAKIYQCPELANKKKPWELSNPIEFINWFESKIQSGFDTKFLYEQTRYFSEYRKWADEIRKSDAQLRRLVRYMKSWADLKKQEMPCGIIMTILTAERYVPMQRDDLAFENVLSHLYDDFVVKKNFVCLRPTTPAGEDLFAGYPEAKKQYFLNALTSFRNAAKQAVANPNQKEACIKWKEHLGRRFSCLLAKDEIEGAKVYGSSGVIGDTTRSA